MSYTREEQIERYKKIIPFGVKEDQYSTLITVVNNKMVTASVDPDEAGFYGSLDEMLERISLLKEAGWLSASFVTEDVGFYEESFTTKVELIRPATEEEISKFEAYCRPGRR